MKDQNVAYRMSIRRLAIMKFMLNEDHKTTPNRENSYWVDGDTFKRFMSCLDTMEDILVCDDNDEDKSILQHEKLLMSKNRGLHPRTARRGKLLSAKSFLTYMLLLNTEKRILMNGKWTAHVDIERLCDCPIPGNKIECKKSAKMYQTELGEKLDKFRLLVKLYYSLDPCLGEVNVQDGQENEKEDYFAIARSFVANFRKFALKLMKDATSAGKMEVGLDVFELHDLMPWSVDSYQQSSRDSIDPSVNGKIMCKSLHFFAAKSRVQIKFKVI